LDRQEEIVMKYRWIVLALVVGLLASPGWGQSGKEEAENLRLQIEALQQKLKQVEAGQRQKKRVTDVGARRLPEQERQPRMVVRVYDLSDLFSLAPPYPALKVSDLAGDCLPLFPQATGTWTGTGPAGMSGMGMGGMGMGGIGGMGMGGMGAMGGTPAKGGMFSVADPAVLPQRRPTGSASSPPPSGMPEARTSIDDLIDAITSTIAPDQWDDVGGPGSIKPLGNCLLISAAEDVHEQVLALLDSFRKRWGTLRTISVQAHWLWLTEELVAGLLRPDEVRPPKPDQPRVYGLVDDAAWESLRKKIGDAQAAIPGGYHAAITCYNGQTVHVFAGGQKQMITSMIPVVGDNAQAGTKPATSPPSAPLAGPEAAAAAANARGVGYSPVVGSVQQGAALQITPMATVSGKIVVLDVHSRVVQVEERHGQANPAAAEPTGSVVRDLAAAVDRPLVVNHHLETTLRAPVDRRMLVGGMTVDSGQDDSAMSLYLFVKVSVQELRDDQPEAKRDALPRPKTPAN
jgi:hypothetical protein